MKYYLEITLIDNPDFGVYALWEMLYTQLHLALVEQQDALGRVPVGVSFPEYRYQPQVGGYLGSKLRLFGHSEAALQALDLTKWFSRLLNYIHCAEIRQVPADRVTGCAQYGRKHTKGSLEKLAKRRAKRHSISLDEAKKHYQKNACSTDLPYVQLTSLTNGQPFQLFISKKDTTLAADEGFGTYGLSAVSSVPEF